MAILRMLPFIIVLIVLIYFLYKGFIVPMLAKAEERDAERKVAFEDAMNTATHVKKSWLEYELGESAVYDLPSMVDVRVPEVAAFNREMLFFNEKYPDFAAVKQADRIASEFVLDARRLGEKFDIAERRARMIDGGNK